jgi:predicted nucleic acid-binding protein
MIILDTDVVSALLNEHPDAAVVRWANRQEPDLLWTTAITVFEVKTGLALMPAGARRRRVEFLFAHFIDQVLGARVLAFDHRAAELAGQINATRKSRGLNIATPDTLIAGIALANYAPIATRNTRHFADLEIDLINPWEQT